MQFRNVLAVSAAVLVSVMGAYGCSSGGGVTGKDGGDAKADAPKPPPGEGGTDGGSCGSGLACELCDVSGYSATAQSTPTATQNACTSNQITSFATACFGAAATQTTCNTWQTQNTPDAGGGACLDCLFTLQSAAKWGALICTSTSCSLNIPGCLDMALNQVSQEKSKGGSGSCGDLLSDSYGCQDYACSTCSTTGASGQTDFDTCVQSAVANECKSYADKFTNGTQCASLQGDAAPAGAAACFPQTDADVPTYLNMFCGSTAVTQ